MSLRDLLTEITTSWAKARTQPFAGHPTATLVRNTFAQHIKKHIETSHPTYIVKASPGAGNWAEVAWLSVLDPLITTSTQSGIYPVYLFRSDGSGVYLSLGFGTTELKRKHGHQGARKKARELRKNIRNSNKELSNWNSTIELHSNTSLGKSYEWASAGAKFYPSKNMPKESVLLADLNELMKIYSELHSKNSKKTTIMQKNSTSLPKPFLLLAGISGTGKTRFVREQAKATGSMKDTYCLTPVRPDWHEPSDLLGYISRLNGEAKYISTDVLEFIVKAWKALIDQGLSTEIVEIQGDGKRLIIEGEEGTLKSIPPHWLCLDEMNLAPVEQYFADYLSVLETREWQWKESKFTYLTDALLKPTIIKEVCAPSLEAEAIFRNSLGLLDNEYDRFWSHVKEYGLGIPFNLIVAGTVNMDETTHGFSRKVIDRALSFDFGEFFPNHIGEFFEPTVSPKLFSFPVYSQAKQDMFNLVESDTDAKITKIFFNNVNDVLKGTPFELAFRAFNELCLSVVSFSPKNDIELAAVFDDFLMCKVLPRIEGDEDKLLGPSKIEGSNILEQLSNVLANELKAIWNSERPDLMRKYVESEDTVTTTCRSRKKLDRMNHLLENGFTSFWP